MNNQQALDRICGEYGCEVTVENIGTADQPRYMAVVKCAQRDLEKIAELEKKIREVNPDIDRVVLDITPNKV